MAVLIEGETEKIEMVINDDSHQWQRNENNSTESKAYKLYVAAEAPLRNGFTRLRLRVWGKVESRIRVSILALFKAGKEAWKKISCEGCKKLIRFIIVSLVAHWGVAAIPAHGVLPDAFWAWLKGHLYQGAQHFSATLTGGARTLFSQMARPFVDDLIRAFEKILEFFNEALKPIDYMLEFICRTMGLCLKEMPELGAA